MMSSRMSTALLSLTAVLLAVAAALPGNAATVEYDLAIVEQEINFTGHPEMGMTLNGGIPGPTLRFTEGDLARIRVSNRMGVDSSIHWHGLLVPPGMDGVPLISFPPIRPGATFTYEFPIRQSGTYWYHSHTNLQEQRGVYGAIVIEPLSANDTEKVDQDHVVLLSDWTDEDPRAVLKTLKRGSDWYALQKGSGQSILGAARMGMAGAYFSRELQRMPPMDIADIAYDRFLANGKPESHLKASPGELVRLRIIDGSATTYFHLEFAGGVMRIVAADGQNVHPVEEKRFLIGVAETYDVLIKVPSSGSYEFRATAHDGSGYARVWIGEGEKHPAGDVPVPNLYHAMGGLSLKKIFALTPAGAMGMEDRKVGRGMFDRPGMAGMTTMTMDSGHEMGAMKQAGGQHEMVGNNETAHSPAMAEMGMEMVPKAASKTEHPMTMEHSGASMVIAPADRSGKKFARDFSFLGTDVSSRANLAMDGMADRPWPPYHKLNAITNTALPRGEPVREIRLTLDGDMERYVWFLNNKPLSETDHLLIKEDEVVRLIMINRTMMHHPMHLHGHFFRVLNGQGDHAPLKHTVDVAPMSTTVIEFDANEKGDWFFHCHLLYHMKSGMARLVHYDDFTIDPDLAAIRPGLYRDSWYFQGRAGLFSNMADTALVLSNTRNLISTEWEVGWQEVDDNEWEGTLKWGYYVNRFFTPFVGGIVEGENRKSNDERGFVGFHYLLPLNIEANCWLDDEKETRISIEKSFELTPRLSITGETRYDSAERWEGGVEISYLVNREVSLAARWHTDYAFGGGLEIRF
ncbi:MAG: multicopper oxidase domain-containing protein [Proteobacteria bacterium]|nr:multicopper oxidase domain-containing protein [Pseudomonadota bacterium]MBU1738155.1 multicopper oxidase domain-containing protein [Pseudomonadota bacterium]